MSLKSLPRCRCRKDLENLLEDLMLNTPFLEMINVQLKGFLVFSFHFQLTLMFEYYEGFKAVQVYHIIVGPDIETFLPGGED